MAFKRSGLRVNYVESINTNYLLRALRIKSNLGI
jgi:hypothetical protein